MTGNLIKFINLPFRLILFVVTFFSLYLTSNFSVFAAPILPPPPPPASAGRESIVNKALPDGLNILEGSDFLQRLISTAIALGFLIGSIVFFFMLIHGAIMWITSKGETWDPRRDPGPLVMAKKQITHALIGLVLLMLIYAIIRVINTIFGVDIINITIPTLI